LLSARASFVILNVRIAKEFNQVNQSPFGSDMGNGGKGGSGQQGWRPRNILTDAAKAAQLMFRADVPLWMKTIIPLAALAYWVWPIDLIPGIVFDDIGVVLLALTMFVRMAEQAVRSSGSAGSSPARDDVVDTTWRVLDEDR
jgi:uncharacterized membrane protein YkvA (DUF1232 family)